MKLHGTNIANTAENSRTLEIQFKPCVPKKRTNTNKDVEKCLVDDPEDPA